MDGISGVRSNEAASLDDVSDSPAQQPAAESDHQTVVQHPGVQWSVEHDSAEPAGMSPAQMMADAQAAASQHREAVDALHAGAARGAEALNHLDKIAPNVVGKEAYYDRFADELKASPGAMKALGKLSPREVEAQVDMSVNQTFPKMPAESRRELTAKLMQNLRFDSKVQAGYGMCDEAKAMIDRAADKLDELAKHPTQLPADTRHTLGLDDCKPNELPRRLSEQASMFRRMAGELDSPAGARAFRAVAEHDVSAAFMRDMGIKPGSFAAEQVGAAREQGKADAAQIEHVKFVCAFAAAVATAGVGAVGVAGMATSAFTSAVMNAPGLVEASTAVDRARAGEISKTMKKGAVERAEHNKHVKQVAFGAEIVTAGLADKFGGHAIGKAIEHTAVGKAMTEEAVERSTAMLIEGTASLASGSAELALTEEQP
jgi:hypothetical protein